MNKYWYIGLVCMVMWCNGLFGQQHVVYYCGERIPLQHDFVYDKLMDVIKKQVAVVNVPALRARAKNYFPIIERYLKQHGLPEDLKYIPIVESGFISFAKSHAGAKGFWQFMPATALDYGLKISPAADEREDIVKSTQAACKLLKDYYNFIVKNRNLASWVLTSAAYNFGIGNVNNAIKQQGHNYFAMSLNKETALYVYKIIAVKELFEYPEIYMKNFGYNVFDANAKPVVSRGGDEAPVFTNIDIQSNNDLYIKEVVKVNYDYVLASIDKIAKSFKDGDLITVTLLEDLHTKVKFAAKGQSYSVPAWIIDGRLLADLGFGHDVVLFDKFKEKGISFEDVSIQKKSNVLLRTVVYP